MIFSLFLFVFANILYYKNGEKSVVLTSKKPFAD